MSKRFSASSAAQLMACPGSANLEKSIPGYIEPEKNEHAGAKGVGSLIHDLLDIAGRLKPKEMLGLAEAMLYVAQLRKKRRFTILTEHAMVANWLPSKPGTTLDVILYTQDEMHILDYKTGVIEVQAEHNEQQMFYAVCAMYLAPKVKGVWIHIVQPWAPTGSSVWYATRQELEVFAQEAIATDKKILAGDTTLCPSDHCTFCPANPHSRSLPKGNKMCPAMMQLLYPSPYNEVEILELL